MRLFHISAERIFCSVPNTDSDYPDRTPENLNLEKEHEQFFQKRKKEKEHERSTGSFRETETPPLYSFLSLHTYIFIRKLSYKISSNPTKCASVALSAKFSHLLVHAKPCYIFWAFMVHISRTTIASTKAISKEEVGWSSKVQS